ncbi:hypothetical protein [Flavobacterium tistrianum]|uniref:hypothetical protein n=1 Tax=Flavobacterium tistrianum TaxID=1685414 RepID=UPI000DAB913E|nr:hypothetical protein [Flavobacterium tistrianum]KAF2341411.1 hypothetical protein DMB71_08175 [Flavobacterium tistrianum]
MKSKFKNIFLKTNINLLLVAMISINLQAQEKVKDTLFFAYDSNYITKDYTIVLVKSNNGKKSYFQVKSNFEIE